MKKMTYEKPLVQHLGSATDLTQGGPKGGLSDPGSQSGYIKQGIVLNIKAEPHKELPALVLNK